MDFIQQPQTDLVDYDVDYDSVRTAQLSSAANATAQLHVFADYTDRKATNTVKAQLGDLAIFCNFLAAVGQETLSAGSLQTDPGAWRGVQWGLIEAFVKWQLREEYSIGSINRRLSTVKTYAKLAAKAGTITPNDLAMIRTVSGYGLAEGANINDARQAEGLQINKGRRKPESTPISHIQAELMMAPLNTPQGRRDRLLMTLLLEHGLRASELSALRVRDINFDEGEMIFVRPKVKGTDKATGRHKLTHATLAALRAWRDNNDMPSADEDKLLRGSRKGGALTAAGMSAISISDRVRLLGSNIGLINLSAHDCRHYTATTMARRGYSVNELCDWFGWNSATMALRYIAAAEVAERDKG